MEGWGYIYCLANDIIIFTVPQVTIMGDSVVWVPMARATGLLHCVYQYSHRQ